MSKELKYAVNHINKIISDLKSEVKDLRIPGANEKKEAWLSMYMQLCGSGLWNKNLTVLKRQITI